MADQATAEATAQALVIPAHTPDPALSRWVRGVFTSVQIERMELHHGGGGGTSHVKTWNHDEVVGKGGPDELIREIYLTAVTDTEGAGFKGRQRYVLLCFVKEQRAPTRCIFQIEAKGWDADEMPMGDYETEPPGKAVGLVAQAQRHAEGAVRMALMGSQQAMQQISRQLDRMSAREDAVAARELRLLELHENLLNRQVERDMDREDKSAKRDLMKQLGNVGLGMLPALLAKVMPGGAGMEPLLMNLVTSLDENQIGMIMGSLNDQQRAQFFELYSMLRQKQEAVAKAQAEAQAAAGAGGGGGDEK